MKDILLLERNKLTSGTTWHAAGLVGQLRATKIETLLSAEALDVYSNLEKETGLSTGFKQCGSLTLGATPERLEVFKRNAARARSYVVFFNTFSFSRFYWNNTHTNHSKINV